MTMPKFSLVTKGSIIVIFMPICPTIQGVPIKMTEFEIEITLEVFDLGNRFRYFWKAGICSYLAR